LKLLLLLLLLLLFFPALDQMQRTPKILSPLRSFLVLL
jgi:hypothetical protein